MDLLVPLCTWLCTLLAWTYIGYAVLLKAELRCAQNTFLPTVFVRELLGLWVRRQRKLVTLTRLSSVFTLFKLAPSTATHAQLLARLEEMQAQMRQYRWAYPASQHDALARLMADAQCHIDRRERAYDLERKLHDWAQRYRQALAAGERAAGWRGVLGLPADEGDAATIKRAYRKLAARAHPDRGGSNEGMARLNAALAQAREELSFV